MGAPVLLKCLFLWVTDFSLKSGDLRDDPGFPVWFTPHGGRGTNRSKVCCFLGLRKEPASPSHACLSSRSGACFWLFWLQEARIPLHKPSSKKTSFRRHRWKSGFYILTVLLSSGTFLYSFVQMLEAPVWQGRNRKQIELGDNFDLDKEDSDFELLMCNFDPCIPCFCLPS